MTVLLTAISLFSLVFVIHCILWRFWTPQRQKYCLLILFLTPFTILCLFDFTQTVQWMSWDQWLYSWFLYIPLVFSYLISFTLVEAEGPTFTILLALHKAREKGLSKEDLQPYVTNELFVDHRLKGLLVDQLAIENGGAFHITSKGLRTLHLFLIPRFLMGRKTYGG